MLIALVSMLTGLTGALAVGCEESGDGSSLTRTDPPAPAAAPVAPPAVPPPSPAFNYQGELVLIPFEVRLAKVAKVAGVPIEDPLLEPLRTRRLDLGDYDFALGIKPDTTWTAARMGTWVKALKPVCASPKMHARFAALPEQLPELVLAAYGRRATDADRTLIDEALQQPTPLDAEGRYQVVCLAVLSSLEFVAR